MRSLIGSLVVAAVTVADFVAFLGRDTTKTLDAATGHESGPWSTAQVAGCLAVLLVVLVAAVWLRVRPLPAAAAMTVAFTAAWTVAAARSDDGGLYPVGAVLVLIGMTLGTGAVALLVARLTHR